MELQQNRQLTGEKNLQSSLLGTGFLAALALGNDGGFKSGSKVIGKGIKLGIAVNFDGFLGGVAYHVAVVAPSQMVFQFRFCAVVNDAVQVIG